MRAVSTLVAVVALAAAVTSACGQEGAPGSAAAGSASPGTASSATPASGSTPVSGGCRPGQAAVSGGPITVGVGDNGKALCVKQGTGITVILRGTATRKWSPIQVSSDALAPRANGGLTLTVGTTGAYFMAVRAGTSVISSARPACAGAIGGPVSSGNPGTPGGTMHCNVMAAFRVTVDVSG